MRLLPLLVLMPLSGCFYINGSTHQDRLDPDDDQFIEDDCAPYDADAWLPGPFYADADGDGAGDPDVVLDCGPHPGFVENADDCDDNDSLVLPGAAERCDGLGIDDDCDGKIDDEDDNLIGTSTFYPDLDGDGWGDGAPVEACSAPAGMVRRSGDCDDGDAGVNPDAVEVCGGGDEDCDQAIDDADDDVTGTNLFWIDDDGDGFGDPAASVARCALETGLVDNQDDCNDAAAGVNPNATEVCDADQVDENCNGLRNESGATITYYADADGDGFGDPGDMVDACAQPSGFVVDHSDCNDSHAGINPNATEVCDPDDADENCNGLSDDADPGPRIGTSYLPDVDEDGFGDASADAEVWCDSVPADRVADASDCDDLNDAIRPGADELCDTIDNDCDGLIDDDDIPFNPVDWYLDEDGDGFGSGVAVVVQACLAPSAQHAPSADDCDDHNPSVNPGGIEVCGGGDEDCDGLVDDNDSSVTQTTTFFTDGDGDGFGDLPIDACIMPAGAVTTAGDCDDAAAEVNPAAIETCAAGDRNCDNDDDAGAIDATRYYADADGDLYGDPNDSELSCSPVASHVTNPFDCDDSAGSINPDAQEVCGGGDEDCDGQIDDADSSLGGALNTFYADADADGFGSDTSVQACLAPGGFVANNDDCHDGNALVNPNGTEVCDANDVDEDCNGVADDSAADAGTMVFYYQDNDLDGYGGGLGGSACDPPEGFVAAAGDCNDANAAINPGREEICDDQDDDEDCDGASEAADPEGALGERLVFIDLDQDGFGDDHDAGIVSCELTNQQALVNTDCDDGENDTFPGATELAGDLIDSNCDTLDFVCGESLLLVPTYFATIADAVAASCSGDEINLLPGIYNESQIDVRGKSIEIDALDSGNRPIIDGGGNGPILYVDGDTILDDLVFQNGSATDGGCLFIDGGAPEIYDSHFDLCAASQRGGAAYVAAGSPLFEDTTFFGNTAGTDGGAIATLSDLDLDACSFDLSFANGNGGSIYATTSDIYMEGLTFTSSQAAGNGGAIYAEAMVDFDLIASDITDSVAFDSGGGVYLDGQGSTQGAMDSVIFTNNQASFGGGGMWMSNTGTWRLDWDDIYFYDNSTAAGVGGGARLQSVSATDLDDVVFERNLAPDGAAIYAEDVVMDWDRSTLLENVSSAGSIVTILNSTTDARAIDQMDLIDNTNPGGSALHVEAAAPMDVIRVSVLAASEHGITVDGPVTLKNVLTLGITEDHVRVFNQPFETTRIENFTLAVSPNAAGVYTEALGAVELVNGIITNNVTGVEVGAGNVPAMAYNNLFNNTTDYVGMVDPGGTNSYLDPDYLGGFDFHLAPTSPLIDAGDPGLLDPDDSRSDMGAFGGPFAL